MREKISRVNWELKIIVFFSSVLVLTFLGPFGTYESFTFYERLVFWLVVIGGVGAVMHITLTFAVETSMLGQTPRFARVVIGALLGGLPGAAIVMFVDAVFHPPANGMELLPKTWFQVAILGTIIGTFEFVIIGRSKRTDVGDVSESKSNPLEHPQIITPKILQRLSIGETDKIVSMSMQDHYVEITTASGKAELILMRFSDAIDEAQGIVGARIHRSHWVAAEYLTGVERRGNKHAALLKDGRDLPVSATYLEDAEALLSDPPKRP